MSTSTETKDNACRGVTRALRSVNIKTISCHGRKRCIERNVNKEKNNRLSGSLKVSDDALHTLNLSLTARHVGNLTVAATLVSTADESVTNSTPS